MKSYDGLLLGLAFMQICFGIYHIMFKDTNTGIFNICLGIGFILMSSPILGRIRMRLKK